MRSSTKIENKLAGTFAASFFLILALANSLWGQGTHPEPLLLATNGVAKATIVIGDKATAVEKFAAEELQKYVKKISGAEIPVSMFANGDKSICRITIGTPESNEAIAGLQAAGKIGQFSEEQTGFDGFIVKRQTVDGQNVLVLAANQPRGVLFAVYALLEQLGVRFFGFGEAEEIIPKHRTMQIAALDILEKPQFRYRITNNNNFVSTNTELLVKVADWGAKNLFNTFLLSWDDIGKVATEELTKRGMEIWGSGHVWGQLTPDKTLFKSHPEYFPLINGKRTFPGDKFAISFCYSNPEAMKIFVAKAVAYARQTPILNVFACWPQDGSQHWAQCQCEGCKRYTFSEWNLIIMNQIAQKFEADPILRNMRLQWIAYDESSIPPYKVVPYQRGKNIDLLYANGARDYLAPMDSPENRKCASWLLQDSARKRINTDFKKEPTDDDLAAYQRLTGMLNYLKSVDYQGSVSLLEYVNFHIGYWLDLPFMQNVSTGPWDAQVFPKDMQFYQSNKVAGWADCYDWPNDSPDPFWNRLMARLLWNPYEDVEKIKDDFYTSYYGEAAARMRTYFDDVWKVLSHERPEKADYETLKAIHAQLQQAKDSVWSEGVEAKRIARVDDWHKSIRLAKTSSNLIPDGSFESINIEEGKSLGARGTSGDWRIIHPLSSTLKAADGSNVLQSSGKNCSFTVLSSNYVFEAKTVYKLEGDIFPINQLGAVKLVGEREGAAKIALCSKSLSDLKTNQWNHIAMEWHCRPAAVEENSSIGISCEGFESAAIDNLIIKAVPEN